MEICQRKSSFVFFAQQLGVGKISGRKALQSGYDVVVGTFETSPITNGYTSSQHPANSHAIRSESRSTMAPSIKNGFGEVPPTIPSPVTMGAIVLPSADTGRAEAHFCECFLNSGGKCLGLNTIRVGSGRNIRLTTIVEIHARSVSAPKRRITNRCQCLRLMKNAHSSRDAKSSQGTPNLREDGKKQTAPVANRRKHSNSKRDLLSICLDFCLLKNAGICCLWDFCTHLYLNSSCGGLWHWEGWDVRRIPNWATGCWRRRSCQSVSWERKSHFLISFIVAHVCIYLMWYLIFSLYVYLYEFM